MKFPAFPRLCLTLFPDPSEVQVLGLCDFSPLLLPTPTPFHHYFVIRCNECVFSFFFDKTEKQLPWNLDDTHHFPWSSTKFPDFPWTT